MFASLKKNGTQDLQVNPEEQFQYIFLFMRLHILLTLEAMLHCIKHTIGSLFIKSSQFVLLNVLFSQFEMHQLVLIVLNWSSYLNSTFCKIDIILKNLGKSAFTTKQPDQVSVNVLISTWLWMFLDISKAASHIIYLQDLSVHFDQGKRANQIFVHLYVHQICFLKR